MRFDRIVFIIAIIWYSLTAYFSTGYYHGDEHYQIIEFAGIKTGTYTPIELAWEFKSQIRPAIQPTICYLIFNVCDYISITDPYNKAFILRLLTALFAVVTIYFFTNSCRNMISIRNWKPFLVVSYFLWFLPFINVRFSSETWSGIALLASLAFIIKDNKNYWTFLISGSLLGLSFLFRYQIAAAAFGLILWLIVIKKESFSNIFLVLLSGLVIIIAGTFIDSWFYENAVFAPWNYLKVNLIDGRSAEFGTSPWYYYFYYVFRFSFFPVGIVIISSFLFLLFKRPKSIFIWTILPFIVIHSIIAHKELRFLFPIINLVPVIIFLAIQEIEWNKLNRKWSKLINVLVLVILLINLFGVVTASLKPAGIGRMRITQKIQEIEPEKPINIIHFKNSNPYDPWGDLPAKFYIKQSLHYTKIESLNLIDSIQFEDNRRNFLVVEMKDAQEQKLQDFITDMKLGKIDQSIPGYLIPFLKVYGYKTKDILVLYGEE